MGHDLAVGTEVGVHAQAEGQQCSIVLVGGLHVLGLAPPMGRCNEVLGTLFYPFHGASQLHTHQASQGVFGVGVHLHPEASTHVDDYDANFVLRYPEDVGDESAFHMRTLRADPERQLALCPLIVGDHCPAFHGDGYQAGLGHLFANDAVGPREGRFGVSRRPGVLIADVGSQFGVHQLGIGGSRFLHVHSR